MRTYFPAALAAVILTILGGVGLRAAPDSSPLKQAAEQGDAVDQFVYAQHLAPTDSAGELKWLLRSAEQGYPPAQDLLGAFDEHSAQTDAGNRDALTGEAVRWTSRAAYQALPASQLRLARFYESGIGVPKDPVSAAMWTYLAIDNQNSTPAERTAANATRDRIQAGFSPSDLAKGRRLATAFVYPVGDGLNPIEIHVLTRRLTLTAIGKSNGRGYATINDNRLFPGEPVDVKLDDYTLRLTLVAIDAHSVRFKVTGFGEEITLALNAPTGGLK